MARRKNNHWFDNIIKYFIFQPRTRETRIVRTDNPPLVIGNGILDQINTPSVNYYDYIPWREEETTVPM